VRISTADPLIRLDFHLNLHETPSLRGSGAAPDHDAHAQRRSLPPPAHSFDTDVMRPVVSGKTPFVRFDRNSYSLPHTHVRRPLTLLASTTTVVFRKGKRARRVNRPRRVCCRWAISSVNGSPLNS
jgi:hypothetical protein